MLVAVASRPAHGDDRPKKKAPQTQRVMGRSFEQPLDQRPKPSLSDDLPNYAQSPIDGLFRSTTGDNDSNNVPVQHSNPAADPRLRGCARPCHF